MSDQDLFDVIVVGAGTGGTVLASRIAENGVNPSTGDRLRVALFEGGSYYTRYHEGVEVGGPLRPGIGDPWRRRLVTNIRNDETSLKHWHYDGHNLKAVGGCSLHWGSSAQIPSPRDFYNWTSETNLGWTEEMFKDPIAEAVKMYHVESTPDPSRAAAGAGPAGGRSKGGQMFANVAKQLGLSVNTRSDPRDTTIRGDGRTNCIQCGYCGRGHYCKYDAKRNGLWYLELIGEPNGLKIIPDAEVDHVILEKKGARYAAKGIAYTLGGQQKIARAPRVIVACGTNGTPLVLYRSGYGPKDLLGDKCLVENDNVGRHLTGDVVGLEILMAFGEDIHGGGGGAGVVMYQEDDGNRSVVSMSGIGGIPYQNRYPDLVALLPVAPDFGREHKTFVRTVATRVGTVGLGMRAMNWAGGRIGLRGEHLYRRDEPAILGRILKYWPTAQEIVRRLDPKPIKVDDTPPDTFGLIHESGTCRAGVSRKNSVVTPDFDAHDIDGLMLGSAAVIPFGCHTGAHLPTVVVNCHAWRRIVANHFTRGAAPLKL